MKRIMSILIVAAIALSFAACGKKQETAKAELKDIPKAYVGDVDVEQTIKTGDLEIIIKEATFYVNDIMFTFKEFEKTQKLSTQMGESMLDVYVKGGKLQKCVVFSEDNTVETTYNIKGKSAAVKKCVYDEYGNKVYEAFYNGDGKLQSFYTATYEKVTLKEKREYNRAMDLTAVTEYEYDKDGKLLREIVYGADLKLKEVKEK